MKGAINWLKGFGTASLISLVFAEAVIIAAEIEANKKEKKLKEYYLDELNKCKDQNKSETTE